MPAAGSAAPAAQSEAPAASGGALWERVSARLGEKFPPGTAMLISDPLQVGVREADGGLVLSMLNDFAATMVDRPDILSALSALASDAAGRPVRVSVGKPGEQTRRSAEELDRKLDELRKFEIVKIKDS